MIDPTQVTGATFTLHAFDATTNTGILPLHACGPNGASKLGHIRQIVLLGCNPGNVGTNVTTQVINAKTKNYANIGNITGADEVWFNSGDRRYYLGASKNCKISGVPVRPTAACQHGGEVLVLSMRHTSVLIETRSRNRPIRTRLRPTPNVTAYSFRKLRLSG